MHPIILLGGIAATGWAAWQGKGALEELNGLTKWAVIGGGVYVSYRALKTAGAV